MGREVGERVPEVLPSGELEWRMRRHVERLTVGLICAKGRRETMSGVVERRNGVWVKSIYKRRAEVAYAQSDEGDRQ